MAVRGTRTQSTATACLHTCACVYMCVHACVGVCACVPHALCKPDPGDTARLCPEELVEVSRGNTEPCPR